MSVELNKPVYKTEVVKVSEMPSVKSIKNDSLFLIVQNGFSKQLKYDVLQEQIKSKLIEDIQEDFATLINTIDSLKSSIKQLNSQQEKYSKISSELVNNSSNLSTSVYNTIDNQFAVIKDQIKSIKTFVDSQNLSDITRKILNIENDLGNLRYSYTSDIRSINNSIDNTLRNATDKFNNTLNNKFNEKTTEVIATTDKRYSEVLSNVKNKFSKLSVDISNLSNYSYDKFSIISSNVLNINNNLSTISSDINSIESDILTLSSNVNDNESLLTSAVQKCDELEVKLYGLKYDDPNDSTKVKVVSNGDIDTIYSKLSKTTSDIIYNSTSIQTINNKLNDLCKQEDKFSNYIVSEKSDDYYSINVEMSGYIPIAITYTEVIDEKHKTTLDSCFVQNRFICSNKEAKLQIVNTSNKQQNVNVKILVTYLKSSN